ncbi:MAG TPA: methyltransferase domain-containing protein [Anaerolineae bacterium]|nr:methyltransferase domain-containing protein [Anaerolineae bacterium]HQK13244.1 methyltransferase domain-containing protein [Anaerolineae bacterium]
MEESRCSIEQCDIFDFMAYHVGMAVLHPGGLWATEQLAEKCRLSRESKVLDVACGKGTSAVYLAKKYQCQIAGVDIDEKLIEPANRLAQKQGISGQVTFRVGDALDLPFPANEFDVTLSQAFLILVSDKKQAIQEAMRVTKPGGFIGWLELSFHKPPPDNLFVAAESSACAFCVRNTLTFDEWRALFQECGMTDLEVIAGEMGMRQRRMFRDEGVVNAICIMWKWLFNSRIRRRMNAVFGFFREYSEYAHV